MKGPHLPDHAPRLTARQIEVLHRIALGQTNEQIGIELGVDPTTVKNHVTQIFSELGALNRAHAVYLAMTRGALPCPIAEMSQTGLPCLDQNGALKQAGGRPAGDD